MNDEIRTILHEHARLTRDARSLSDEADLYQVGMTSHASVNVMLALESQFDIEFPDRMLRRDVFASISAMSAAITELMTRVPVRSAEAATA
jgi:acyl carrier protein